MNLENNPESRSEMLDRATAPRNSSVRVTTQTQKHTHTATHTHSHPYLPGLDGLDS